MKLRELRAALKAKIDEARTCTDDREKYDALDAEIRDLSAQIERTTQLDELERNAEGRAIGEQGNGSTPAAEWRALARGEHRAMSSASDPDGGMFVPHQLAAQIVNRLVDISPIRRVANVIQVSTPDFTIPIKVRGFGARWSAENDDRTALTATPSLRGAQPPFGELNSYPQVSNHLLDDAAYDVGAFISDNAATAFAQTEGAAFIAGDGISKPRGFLSVTPEAKGDATRTAGALEFAVSGEAAGFPAADAATGVSPVDPLINLVYTLRAPYRAGAVWIMSSATAAIVRKMKDAEGRFAWQPSSIAGQPDMLLGYPVTIAEDMPAVEAGAFPIAFGNFVRGYTVADRTGIRLIRDEITAPGFTKFYLSKRVGGIVTDDAAIKLLKIAA